MTMLKINEINFKAALEKKLMTISEFSEIIGYDNTLICKLYNTKKTTHSCTPKFVKKVMKYLNKKVNPYEMNQNLKTEDIFIAMNRSCLTHD
jgi:fumarate hydratase class II